MRRFDGSSRVARAGAALGITLALALGGCDDDDDEMDGGRDAGMTMRDASMRDASMRVGGRPDARVDGAVPGDARPDARRPDAGPIGGGAATSAQIQAVRDATPGTIDLAIDDAIVTYVKPNIGDDPAGFFLQAEPTGPAIFVRIDPATLTPAPEVGQVVDLRATDTATEQGRREIVAIGIGSWNVESSGHDVTFLTQDVSGVDLEAMLDDFESELVTATFSLRGAFRPAGAGFQKISIDTAALPTSSTLTLRLPDALVSTLTFEPGCRYTVTSTPLWRLNEEAQVSAFQASEVSLDSCDAPIVRLAVALNERTAVVVFNRVIDPASVMADGSQFTIVDSTTTAIPVTGAMAAAGTNRVLVTTGADMVGGTFYNLTVAATVRDTVGTGVDPTMATDTFEGFTPHLVINELDYDDPGTDDAEFVEIYNPGTAAIPLAGVTLYAVDGGGGTADGMVDLATNSLGLTSLPPGGYLVVLTGSSSGVTVPAGIATVTLGVSALENGPDGLVLRSGADCHDAVFYGGIPPATPFMGCAWEASAGIDSGTPESIGRIPDGFDTHENPLDFEPTRPTPGAANALP
ncbi:MAG TPA: lamin tail domain-containing protein [Sandaracinaceae bacterium]